MQVGDLVYYKCRWAKNNSWMVGTELDRTDKTNLGIVLKVGSAGKLAKIYWYTSEKQRSELVEYLGRITPDKK